MGNVGKVLPTYGEAAGVVGGQHVGKVLPTYGGRMVGGRDVGKVLPTYERT